MLVSALTPQGVALSRRCCQYNILPKCLMAMGSEVSILQGASPPPVLRFVCIGGGGAMEFPQVSWRRPIATNMS